MKSKYCGIVLLALVVLPETIHAQSRSQASAEHLHSSLLRAEIFWSQPSPNPDDCSRGSDIDTFVRLVVDRTAPKNEPSRVSVALSLFKIDFCSGTGLDYSGGVELGRGSVSYLDKRLHGAFVVTKVPVHLFGETVTYVIPVSALWICTGDLFSAEQTFQDAAGNTILEKYSERPCEIVRATIDTRPVGGPKNIVAGIPLFEATMQSLQHRIIKK